MDSRLLNDHQDSGGNRADRGARNGSELPLQEPGSMRLQRDLQMLFSETRLGMERVQAYSDAVLSIIATVLAVPMMKVNESSKKEIWITGGSLFQVLTSKYRMQMFGIYFVCFWLVFLIFSYNSRKFTGLNEGHPVLVYVNWFELFAVSLLPFTAASASNADSASSGDDDIKDRYIRTLHLNILAVAVAHAVFHILSWFLKPTRIARVYVEEAIVITVVCIFALGMSFVNAEGAFACYGLLVFVSIYYKIQGKKQTAETILANEEEEEHQGQETQNELWTRRLEAFTDGVLAISATLIVLDITPPPACKDLKTLEDCIIHWDDGCRPAGILEFKCEFDDDEHSSKGNWLMLAYVLTFIMVNILWTLHHYLFEKVVQGETGDFWTSVLNGTFCVFVALIPFSFSLVTDYAIQPLSKSKFDPFNPGEKINPDEEAAATACCFAGIVIFLASSCLLGLMIHHHWKHARVIRIRDYVRFTSIPVISAVTVCLLAVGVNQVALYPLFSIPIIFLCVRGFVSPLDQC